MNKDIDHSWDFSKSGGKYLTHNYHTYPAMMIPQIAGRLIDEYGKNGTVLLDPFMGSGTALVEATLHKNFKKAYGIDINPLALLIGKVKTRALNTDKLDKVANAFVARVKAKKRTKTRIQPPEFDNIHFWFKPRVIMDLALLKNEIDNIENDDIRDFFKVTFSEVVRKVSNTRNGEFKLYRIPANDLAIYDPDSIFEFEKKLSQNIERMKAFVKNRNSCKITILPTDTRKIIPIGSRQVDIIVTSPPYGDSKTTVAYGQFSRLALQWLGYDKETVISIDKISLGGRPTRSSFDYLQSQNLKSVIKKIYNKDEKRAHEVLSFYVDFFECIKQLDRVMKKKGKLCFVVGNRTVKGVKIPTDKILVDLFLNYGGYKHIKTIIRSIPNKRMPRVNSPTNIPGEKSSTMNEEYIVILEKKH